MALEPDVVALLAVIAVSLAGVLLLVVLVLALRLRALRRTFSVALGGDGAKDVVTAVQHQAEGLVALREDLGVVHANTEKLRDLHRGAVSRVGLVRYDAFPDMGGMLSFSSALLDETGSGIVLSSINGRQETRSYGKPIVGGTSEHNLSEEEQDAVRAAIEQRTSPALDQPRRRRGRRE